VTARDQDDTRLDDIEIGPLTPLGVKAAIGVLARGMRDNPNHVAAFGEDPSLRLLRLGRFLESLQTIAPWEVLAARDDEGTIVGVLALTKPSRCGLPSVREAPALSRHSDDNPEMTLRIAEWLKAWNEVHPRERHWHFGPMAVEASLQGRGIGSELLRVFCAQLDAGREDAYLETDRVQNVRFYERFGFEVVGERTVLGARNWFMIRRPRGGAGEIEGGISP
jgi:ribosomal protein S18 acetylase RimI-like enzyme